MSEKQSDINSPDSMGNISSIKARVVELISRYLGKMGGFLPQEPEEITEELAEAGLLVGRFGIIGAKTVNQDKCWILYFIGIGGVVVFTPGIGGTAQLFTKEEARLIIEKNPIYHMAEVGVK